MIEYYNAKYDEKASELSKQVIESLDKEYLWKKRVCNVFIACNAILAAIVCANVAVAESSSVHANYFRAFLWLVMGILLLFFLGTFLMEAYFFSKRIELEKNLTKAYSEASKHRTEVILQLIGDVVTSTPEAARTQMDLNSIN